MSEELASNYSEAENLVLKYVADPRPDTKDLVIVHYSGMVERVARRFSGVEPVDDLVQVGFIGLLNALSKFDPQAGVRFNTYATHLVAGEIKHYLRDRSQTIRHPAWLQELRHKVTKAATTLQAELGRTPTNLEVAELVGVSESAVQEVYATQEMIRVASLDVTPGDGEEGDSDLDRIDSAIFNPEQVSVEDRVLLETAMQQLRDLERDVLCLFHFDALNQTEIASRLGISCNYVSHILRQSLGKLRKILSNEGIDESGVMAPVTEQASVLDSETGLYSEDYFRSRLTEELHRACSSGGTCSVINIDVSGLSSLGEFYGDSAVTDFLTDVGSFLKTNVRALDIVCRNGETSFGIILPGTGRSVDNICARIEARIRQWVASRTVSPNKVTMEMGYATIPDDGRTVADIIRAVYRKEQSEVRKAG